jgi:hypothetical protein
VSLEGKRVSPQVWNFRELNACETLAATELGLGFFATGTFTNPVVIVLRALALLRFLFTFVCRL